MMELTQIRQLRQKQKQNNTQIQNNNNNNKNGQWEDDWDDEWNDDNNSDQLRNKLEKEQQDYEEQKIIAHEDIKEQAIQQAENDLEQALRQEEDAEDALEDQEWRKQWDIAWQQEIKERLRWNKNGYSYVVGDELLAQEAPWEVGLKKKENSLKYQKELKSLNQASFNDDTWYFNVFLSSPEQMESFFIEWDNKLRIVWEARIQERIRERELIQRGITEDEFEDIQQQGRLYQDNKNKSIHVNNRQSNSPPPVPFSIQSSQAKKDGQVNEQKDQSNITQPEQDNKIIKNQYELDQKAQQTLRQFNLELRQRIGGLLCDLGTFCAGQALLSVYFASSTVLTPYTQMSANQRKLGIKERTEQIQRDLDHKTESNSEIRAKKRKENSILREKRAEEERSRWMDVLKQEFEKRETKQNTNSNIQDKDQNQMKELFIPFKQEDSPIQIPVIQTQQETKQQQNEQRNGWDDDWGDEEEDQNEQNKEEIINIRQMDGVIEKKEEIQQPQLLEQEEQINNSNENTRLNEQQEQIQEKQIENEIEKEKENLIQGEVKQLKEEINEETGKKRRRGKRKVVVDEDEENTNIQQTPSINDFQINQNNKQRNEEQNQQLIEDEYNTNNSQPSTPRVKPRQTIFSLFINKQFSLSSIPFPFNSKKKLSSDAFKMWELSALRRINKLADAYSSRLDALLTHRAASIVSASQEPQQMKNEKQDNKEQKLKKERNNGWEEDEQQEEDIEDINQIENEDSNLKLKTEYDHELKHLREYTFKRSIDGIRSDKESTIAFVSGILRAIADVLGRSEVMNEAN